jgi:serine acetyltransferase
MKATLGDLARCGILVAVIFAMSLALVGTLVHPVTTHYLAEYHVVVDFLALLVAYGVVSGLLIRFLVRIRKLEPGEHTEDSSSFAYWKLLTILHRLGQSALMPFTPVFLRPVVATLFGARVGRNVAIGGSIDDPYLVALGDGAILGNNSLVAGSMMTGGRLTVGDVRIGAGATVGANSVILPGTHLGDGAQLLGGSIVVAGTKIPAGETWRGNPARKWQ